MSTHRESRLSDLFDNQPLNAPRYPRGQRMLVQTIEEIETILLNKMPRPFRGRSLSRDEREHLARWLGDTIIHITQDVIDGAADHYDRPSQRRL